MTSSLFNFDIHSLHSAKLNFYQDTLKTGNTTSDLANSDSVPMSSPGLRNLNQSLDSSQKNLVTKRKINTVELKDSTFLNGSTSRVYSDFVPAFQKLSYNPESVNSNFLSNIAEKTIDIHFKTNDSIQNINASTVSIPPVAKTRIPSGFEGNTRIYDNNGWYIFVLLISISIFAWGKSLYQKYLLQVINSVYNYQISVQLFRDKNALFRNLSLILQVLCPINIGLLVYFLIDFYNFNHISTFPLASIALYSLIVFLFFKLKNILYKFLGVLFKVQEDFHEIQHHMNVFVQTIGIVLLPFIVSMPFIEDNLKNYFLLALFLITGIFVLLFFFRGFQIVSRKQVPIFFLILYLCAVEFLPVALLIKASYSMV